MSLKALLLLWLSVAAVQVRAGAAEDFAALFQQEVDNRATALRAVTALAARDGPSPQTAFWDAYQELEELNQRLYRPHAERHGIRPARWMPGLKARLSRLAAWLMPETFVELLARAAADHARRLGALPAMAGAGERSFFAYVVAQEQAQAEALAHAARGRHDLAAQRLRDFLATQAIVPAPPRH